MNTTLRWHPNGVSFFWAGYLLSGSLGCREMDLWVCGHAFRRVFSVTFLFYSALWLCFWGGHFFCHFRLLTTFFLIFVFGVCVYMPYLCYPSLLSLYYISVPRHSYFGEIPVRNWLKHNYCIRSFKSFFQLRVTFWPYATLIYLIVHFRPS